MNLWRIKMANPDCMPWRKCHNLHRLAGSSVSVGIFRPQSFPAIPALWNDSCNPPPTLCSISLVSSFVIFVVFDDVCFSRCCRHFSNQHDCRTFINTSTTGGGGHSTSLWMIWILTTILFACQKSLMHNLWLLWRKAPSPAYPATFQRHPFLTAHIQNLLMKCLSRTAGIGFRLNPFTRARTWVSRDVLLPGKSIYPDLHNLPVVSHDSNDTLIPLCGHTNSRICCARKHLFLPTS